MKKKYYLINYQITIDNGDDDWKLPKSSKLYEFDSEMNPKDCYNKIVEDLKQNNPNRQVNITNMQLIA